MQIINSIVVAIKTPTGKLVKGFDVCNKGSDVYVNYSDSSTPSAHTSYHASGQLHFKKGGDYIEWTGGPSGAMEPMKLFRKPPSSITGTQRAEFWTVGWEIAQLDHILPVLIGAPDMTVDASKENPSFILGLKASLVGPHAPKKNNEVGFPIIALQTFPRTLNIEIYSFLIGEGLGLDDSAF